MGPSSMCSDIHQFQLIETPAFGWLWNGAMAEVWTSTESTAISESGYGRERGRQENRFVHHEEKPWKNSHRIDKEDEVAWSDASSNDNSRSRETRRRNRSPDGSDIRDGTRRGRLLTEIPSDSPSPSPSRVRQRTASHGTGDDIRLLMPSPLAMRDHRSDESHSESHKSGRSASSQHRDGVRDRQTQDSRFRDSQGTSQVTDRGNGRDHSLESEARSRARSPARHSASRPTPSRHDRSSHQSTGRRNLDRDDRQHRRTGRHGGSKHSHSSGETSSRYRDSASDEIADSSQRGHSPRSSTKMHRGGSQAVQLEQLSEHSSPSRTRSMEDVGHKVRRVQHRQKRSPSPSSRSLSASPMVAVTNRGHKADSRQRDREDVRTDDDRHRQHHQQHNKDARDATRSAWEAAVRNGLRAGTMAALDCHDTPGDWLGDKGTRVATAALKAAIVDTYMEHRHPQSVNGFRHTAMRQAAEYAITNALAGPLMQLAAEERRRRR